MFNKRVESAVQTCPDRGSTPLSSTITGAYAHRNKKEADKWFLFFAVFRLLKVEIQYIKRLKNLYNLVIISILLYFGVDLWVGGEQRFPIARDI